MSATNETGALGAPIRITLQDAIEELRDVLAPESIALQFLESLQKRIAPVAFDNDVGEERGFALEHAMQSGFENIDDDADLFVVSAHDLAEYTLRLNEFAADRRRLIREIDVALNGTSVKSQHATLADLVPQVVSLAEQRETYEAVARGRLRLIRELDVALNGHAGAAEQASMLDLIAQVTRQQCVQIANLPDGMRINFRAPDGLRATLNLAVLLDDLVDVVPDLVPIMHDAIAAYPVAGVPE